MGNGPENLPQLLLVEDNDADAYLFSYFLTEVSFSGKFNRVRDGEEAMDYIFKNGAFSTAPSPDIIVLDLGLPKLSGVEVLKKIKRGPNRVDTPVLVLTTAKNDADILSCLNLGAAGFYTKPADVGDIHNLVQRLVLNDFPRLLRYATYSE